MKKDEKCLKKKIVFFIGGLNFGGMERVIFIAKELLEVDYDIQIVTLYQTEADYEKKDEYYNLDIPPSSKKIRTFCRRLVKTVKMKRQLKPDKVFSFGMYLNYLNILSNYFVKRKPKTIVGIRSYDWLVDPFFQASIDKWIMQHADKVNSVSKLIAKDAEKIWKIPLSRNQVIYNPYDINYIQELSEKDIDDFQFEPGKYYFVTMGRLSDQKGYGHLIRAFAEVVNKYKNVRLLILGNGNRRIDLERMIQQYGLEQYAFLPGGKENPYPYVRKANAYVMSSITEGFPNALSEAMCIGTPVISVNCKSGPSEILFESFDSIDENQEFWIADFGILTKEMMMDREYIKKELSLEEKSLAEAMLFAYEHDEYMTELAQKAKEHMKEFNYVRFKEAFINALEE